MSLNQEYAATVGDLLMRSAEIRAANQRQRAAGWANVIGNAAQSLAAIPEQRRKAAAEARDAQADALRIRSLQNTVAQQERAPVDAERKRQAIAEAWRSATNPDGAVDYEKAAQGIAQIDPEAASHLNGFVSAQRAAATDQKNRTQKAIEAFADSLAHADTVEKQGLTVAAARTAGIVPSAALDDFEQNLHTNGDAYVKAYVAQNSPLARARAMEQSKTITLNAGDKAFRNGQVVAENPAAPKVEKADTEWVIRSGRPVQIPKGTAQPGDRPYSAAEFAPSKPDAEPLVSILRDGKPVLVPRSQAVGQTPANAGTVGGETDRDRQHQARIDAASSFLTRLNELRSKINTKMGPEAGITGLSRKGASIMGMDPDVAEYERERKAGGRALAVAIMGAQNLSDNDAQAWADMLPAATVDAETARRLMAQVYTQLGVEPPDDVRGKPKPVPSHRAAPSATPADGWVDIGGGVSIRKKQ